MNMNKFIVLIFILVLTTTAFAQTTLSPVFVRKVGGVGDEAAPA